MALKYTRRVERINFGEDNYLDVHGLGVPAITSLVAAHRDTAEHYYSQFEQLSSGGITADQVGDLMMNMIVSVPAVAAHIIALGADEESRVDEIADLPPDVQLAAIEKVAELTFAMSGGIVNFLETVHRISVTLNRLTSAAKALRVSTGGSPA